MPNEKPSSLLGLEAKNILFIALDSLDYETYIKKLSENNPIATEAFAKERLPEEEFEKVSENLKIALSISALQDTFGFLSDVFSAIANPDNIKDD